MKNGGLLMRGELTWNEFTWGEPIRADQRVREVKVRRLAQVSPKNEDTLFFLTAKSHFIKTGSLRKNPSQHGKIT